MKMVARLAYPDVDYNEIQRIIEKDPLLCGELLRSVNSAQFARREPLNTVKQAVAYLGTSKLRRLALSLTVTNLFGRARTGEHWSQLRFNLHSAAVGVLTQILASHLPTEHGDSAFVAGLLHDIGKFAIAANLRAQHRQIWDLHQVSLLPMIECEREVLGFDHAEVSGGLLARWDIPDYVCKVVYNHHAPEMRRLPSGQVGLDVVLNRADQFVNSLGMRSEPESLKSEQVYKLSFSGFDLDHEAIASQFVAEFDEFREFMK